jgi:hypothetical protein
MLSVPRGIHENRHFCSSAVTNILLNYSTITFFSTRHQQRMSMDHKKLNRIVAFGVFLASIAAYLKTLPPTIVFWDVSEHCTASYFLQVQHPPGSPLLTLVLRIASMIPLSPDIGVRMILFNVFASCAVIVLLYLITVRCILMWREVPTTTLDAISVYGAGAVGALALAFSTTFWFNSIEVETRNTSLLFTALIIWLVLLWYEKAEEKQSDLYLLMITFLVGLTAGIHIHGLLGFVVAILLVYLRFYPKTLREFLFSADVIKFGVVAMLIFMVAYPGIVKWFPSMLDSDIFGIRSSLWIGVAIGLVAAAIYFVWSSTKKNNRLLNVGALAFLFILLGYSTYVTIVIRANAGTPMNQNDPSTLRRLVAYLEREQYGETPLMNRRFSLEPDKQESFKKYTSDWDYMWSYQIKHMYWRYIAWNFIGRENDIQDADWRFSQLYAIPFLVGLIGCYYHWKKHQKMAFIMTVFFILTGLALAIYFNMQEPQPRERDYFFVYSVFAFCFWIGLGTLAIVDFVREKFAPANIPALTYGAFALVVVLVPGNMLRTNYHPMNRSGHYLAWDYSYNLLQSVEKDAILITAGDNDTFPLWYMQDVEGVRRDVRIVNLSLANMDYYIKQLKHARPYGAKPVPISLSDEQIDGIGPMEYQSQMIRIPIPKFALEGRNAPRVAVEGGGQASISGDDRAIVDTMRFVMPATLRFGNRSALRVQDILVYDIVRTMGWERPVYFAITAGGDESKIGLRDYLELEGMAYKLVPHKKQAYWAAVNEERTRAHLFSDLKLPSKDPSYGCLWRGLQDSTVKFDENQRRMITSYRQPFYTLAMYCSNVKNKPEEMNAVLDRMEQVVPRRLHAMDFRLKADIAVFYGLAGNKARQREFLRELTEELGSVADAAIGEQFSQYHPLAILLQAHQGLEEYDKALEVVQKIQRVFASTPGIPEFANSKKAELETLKKGTAQTPAGNAPKDSTSK